jgi:acyl carrier protein
LEQEVSQWLMNWFSGRSKRAHDSTGMLDTNYFEAGLLSSAEVVEFVTEIEARFGIQFSEGDLSDARFVTISGLTQLIEQHLRPASTSRVVDGM